ncbi:MAG TPA: hypothetical protein VJS44_15275 [Pyrinomonadaceae bacterium]|nr:hypothetical protein [Pyrinomonadaceae bacterium]
MKITRPLIFSLLLAALLCPLTYGPTLASAGGAVAVAAQANQNDVASIEVYARGLDGYIRRNARAARYFADNNTYEAEDKPVVWQEFRTKAALDAAWQNGKTYSSSNVWFSQTGELVVALFTFSSPSGDWAQYMTNYYRKDGTLAKSSAELRTFMGDIIRIYDRLYDDKGKLLREQTRFLDLKTRRPKRVKKDEFMDMEAPLYASTSALPFYKLLKKR